MQNLVSAMYLYFEMFSVEIKPSVDHFKVFITCVCGNTFQFKPHPKANSLGNCPHCNELWHVEKSGQEFLIIRPRTNAMVKLEPRQ